MAVLLDANLLIAMAWPQHIHHRAALTWFERLDDTPWATCPLTELAFVRISSNRKIIPDAVPAAQAVELLTSIVGLPHHQFWPDSVTPTQEEIFRSLNMIGHRQVTDAYLLALARHRKGKLATFDGGISELLGEAADRSRYIELVEPD